MEQNTNTGVPITPVIDNKQKNGNGLKIAAAIACVVAVCGIGFGVYGMMQSIEKDNQISDLKAKVADSVITPKKYGFLSSNFVSQTEKAVMTEKTMNGAEFSLTSSGDVSIEVINEGCAYYGNACDENRHYKNDITSLIPGRAVDMSINRYGNGGTNWAFFALEDGTIVSLSEFDAIAGKQATMVEGSKDIFRLFSSYGYAEDTSGKIYEISPVDYNLDQFKIGNDSSTDNKNVKAVVENGFFTIKDSNGDMVIRDATKSISEIVSCDTFETKLKCSTKTTDGKSVWYLYEYDSKTIESGDSTVEY